jgi:hypothetical protein
MEATERQWSITHECADRYRQRVLRTNNRQEPVRWKIDKGLQRSFPFEPPAPFVAKAIINNGFKIAEYRYDPEEDTVYVVLDGKDVVTCYRFDPRNMGKKPTIEG